MAECRQYLAILLESSQKKVELLDFLIQKSEEQAEAVKLNDIELFDVKTEEKMNTIEELNKLDEGFTSVYDKVAKELSGNKKDYWDEIQKLQRYISQITDKSIAIQALEKRNKTVIEQYFAQQRQNIRKSKAGLKTASDYYKSMSKVDYTTPQMLDKKK